LLISLSILIVEQTCSLQTCQARQELQFCTLKHVKPGSGSKDIAFLVFANIGRF
jgi:hypothetical protein